jgi:hypothetical protein
MELEDTSGPVGLPGGHIGGHPGGHIRRTLLENTLEAAPGRHLRRTPPEDNLGGQPGGHPGGQPWGQPEWHPGGHSEGHPGGPSEGHPGGQSGVSSRVSSGGVLRGCPHGISSSVSSGGVPQGVIREPERSRNRIAMCTLSSLRHWLDSIPFYFQFLFEKSTPHSTPTPQDSLKDCF